MNQLSTKSMRRILVLDDEVFQANALRLNLTKNDFDVVDAVYSGIRAIKSVELNRPDVVLLDINLDKENIDGIDVGNKIHEIDKNIIIIYITAYPSEENFRRALESMPFSFIEKPYKMKTIIRDIEMATQKAVSKIEQTVLVETDESHESPKGFKVLCFPNFLLVNEGEKGFFRLAIDDILYLEADNVWTVIHTKQGKKLIVNLGLSNFIEEVNYPQLVKAHRSFGVNLDNIGHFKIGKTGGRIEIGDQEIPVSKGQVQQFWQDWKNYFGTDFPTE